jgi:hypothetical protein
MTKTREATQNLVRRCGAVADSAYLASLDLNLAERIGNNDGNFEFQ